MSEYITLLLTYPILLYKCNGYVPVKVTTRLLHNGMHFLYAHSSLPTDITKQMIIYIFLLIHAFL